MKKEELLNLEFTEEKDNYRLQLYFAHDEKGIVYRATSVLSANRWNILGATIRSLENGQVEDEFLIHSSEGKVLDETELDLLKQEMLSIFSEEISIPTYLIKKNRKAIAEKGNPNAMIQIESGNSESSIKMRIKTNDREGLLCDIARIFYLECVDILSVNARTIGDIVDDTFELQAESGSALDKTILERLEKNLRNIL